MAQIQINGETFDVFIVRNAQADPIPMVMDVAPRSVTATVSVPGSTTSAALIAANTNRRGISNFSSWYNQSEGTTYWEGVYNAPVERALYGYENASTPAFYRASRAFNQGRTVFAVGGINQADLYSGNQMILGSNSRMATALRVDDFAQSLNGQAVVSDSSGTVPVVDKLTIGQGPFTNQLGGTIKRLAYWHQRLPNSTLANITA